MRLLYASLLKYQQYFNPTVITILSMRKSLIPKKKLHPFLKSVYTYLYSIIIFDVFKTIKHVFFTKKTSVTIVTIVNVSTKFSRNVNENEVVCFKAQESCTKTNFF